MNEDLRNLIRTLRQRLGMTQEEFARTVGVTVSTVNRWENAHTEPGMLAWKAIGALAQSRGLGELAGVAAQPGVPPGDEPEK